MRYLRFIDVLRGEGDPDSVVTVKKPDGSYVNAAPLSTLLREWDALERENAMLKESVSTWQQVALHRNPRDEPA